MSTKTETKIDLKINYLTEEQYNDALTKGEINENEIYMTPDEEVEYNGVDSLTDLGVTATAAELNHMSGIASNVQEQLDVLTQNVDGKANSSHGTHVTYSTTAPVMDGTASAGSATTVARSDHKHPTDTSRASQSDFNTLEGRVNSHIANTSNPHNVTAEQIGIYTSSTQPTNANNGNIWINSSDDEPIKILENNVWTSISGKSDFLIVRVSSGVDASHSAEEISSAVYSDNKLALLLYDDEIYYFKELRASCAYFERTYMDNYLYCVACISIDANSKAFKSSVDSYPMLPDSRTHPSGVVLTTISGQPSWEEPTWGLPEYTEADSGKVLTIVNGVPTWAEGGTNVTIPSAKGVKF